MQAKVAHTKDLPVTSDIDVLMRKVEARSKKATSWMFISVFLIMIVLVIGVVGIYKQNRFGEQQAQATLEAREANKQRQEELAARQDNTINHIDCVLLLTKKYPKVNFQALNYDQTSEYLRECVSKE